MAKPSVHINSAFVEMESYRGFAVCCAADLLSPERIKKELTDEDSSQLSASSSITSVVTSPGCGSGGSSRVKTVSGGGRGGPISGRLGTSSSGGQKTILLVQAVGSKSSSSPSAGGGSPAIQSLLLPASLRSSTSTPAADPILSNRHGNNAVSKLSGDSVSVTPARLGVRVVSIPSQGGPNPTTTGAPGQSHIDVQTPYGLVFNSRTIQADGTVCTSKEYLCNFCQFKVSTPAAILDHSTTHLFSCNHCSFRSTSRRDCLCHKRATHPSTLDELAGFEDLDRPNLVVKTARIPRIVGTAALLPGSSANSRLGPSSSLGSGGGAHPPRSGVSLLGAASAGPSRPISSSSNVVRASGKTGDSYFTYRIAHDQDGRVQAYECDVCGFRSGSIKEMFAHAATHSLADLAKSGTTTSGSVVWECFYCPYFAPLQASVVSHVIASHPNQPIQLKRLPTNPPATTAKTLPDPPAVKTSPSKSSSDMPCLTPELPLTDKIPATPPVIDGERPAKTPSAKSDRKKKSESAVGDEGCIWGCYYCSMQSASRNDIISHLKKQHTSEKLVVTRRRITHVPAGGAADSKPQVPTPTSSDANKPEDDPAAETPAKSETKAGSEDGVKPDDSGGKPGVGKSRKRPASNTAAANDVQQAENTELCDWSGLVGGALAKSRRKQTAPRKVADELPTPGKPALSEEEIAQAAAEAVNGLANVLNSPGIASEIRPAAGGGGSSKSLLASNASGQRKHGRGSLSKYDNLIKKLKMADSEDNALEMAKILEKPRAEVPSRPSSQGKALSLLTGQLVSGYVQPPSNGIPTLPASDTAGKKSGEPKRSSGLKGSVVRFVERTPADRRQSYVYDGARSTARCGVCGTTSRGPDALRQMREHVAAHFDECRWACAYCSFQCSHRAAVMKHATSRHRDRPLRIICRRKFAGNGAAGPPKESLPCPVGKSAEKVVAGKLRGPRSHREGVRISTAGNMWQCAFCSRRSLFRGFIIIHMKLAHFDNEDGVDVVPQRWIRPAFDPAPQDMKTCRLDLVRIEAVDRYSSLSDVILSNGENLVRELDADDDESGAPEPEVVAGCGQDDAGEYRCVHCPYRGPSPAVVKHHVLQTHRSEEVTVLDLRSSRRRNHEHLLMCRSVECQSISSVEADFRAHLEAHPSHAANNIIAVPRRDPKPVQTPRPSQHSKNPNKALPSDAAVTSASSRGGSKSRRGTDGPIEYNDDGTIKGLEIGGDVNMQCTHCCTTMNCDVSEMRAHLSSSHPRLVPLAIQVDCADTSQPASMFCCVVADCTFVTSYYNVYKHHMDVEHPDSETGIVGMKHRPNVGGGAGKRRFSGGGGIHHNADKSFSPSFRRSKKSAASVLGMDGGGGGDAGNSPKWDDLPSDVSDYLTPPMSKKSTCGGGGSQYSSQEFDFSRRYKCVLCSFTAATLAAMKSHLTATHDAAAAHQCIDRRARQLRKRQGIYFCMDAACAFCCKFDDELAQHVDQEHPALRSPAAARPDDPAEPRPSEDASCDGDRVYQCAHCTYITTDLRNVRIHVVAEHSMTEGGFAEIKTAVSSDGSLIMNVNDAAAATSKSSDTPCPLENGNDLASVKVDDEGKVFAVL